VEKVSAEVVIEGEMHTMKVILAFPLSESLKTLVNLEFLKGIWVLFLSISAEMQWPRDDSEPLI
jgi:hypothetical protein